MTDFPADSRGIVAAAAVVTAGGALAWAVITDIRHYIIPNAVCVIVVVAYILAATTMPLADGLRGAATATAVFAVGALLFVNRHIGGGDVKLIASLSLWAGPTLLAPFAIVTCLAALALSALMLSPFGTIMPAASASATAMTGSKAGVRRAMPFGVAIAAGGFYLLARHLAQGH